MLLFVAGCMLMGYLSATRRYWLLWLYSVLAAGVLVLLLATNSLEAICAAYVWSLLWAHVGYAIGRVASAKRETKKIC